MRGRVWTRPRSQCPGADSNRDAFRHYPLKIACLPVSPPGRAASKIAAGKRRSNPRYPKDNSLPLFELTHSQGNVTCIGYGLPLMFEPASVTVTAWVPTDNVKAPIARVYVPFP